MSRTYSVAQGDWFGGSLRSRKDTSVTDANARRKTLSHLKQGESTISSWNDHKNDDLGVVAPLQYYRVPGDPDRSLHNRSHSWYRMLGSQMDDHDYKDPLGGGNNNLLTVTGGEFNLLAGSSGAQQRPDGLMTRIGRLLFGTGSEAPGMHKSIEQRNKDREAPLQPQQGYFKHEGPRTRAGDLERPFLEGFEGHSYEKAAKWVGFNNDQPLVEADDRVALAVDGTIAGAGDKLAEYGGYVSDLSTAQQDFIDKTETSRAFRNKFVDADAEGSSVPGYVTNRGVFIQMGEGVESSELAGKRGCGTQYKGLQNPPIDTFFSRQGIRMKANEGCPPSGENVQVTGVSDPNMNKASPTGQCFEDKTKAFELQPSLHMDEVDNPNKSFKELNSRCHTLASDYGRSAYSIYDGSYLGGGYDCYLAAEGLNYDDIAPGEGEEAGLSIEVRAPGRGGTSTAALLKAPVDEGETGGYRLRVLNNGRLTLGPPATESDHDGVDGVGAAIAGCSALVGARINNIESATYGSACAGAGPCDLQGEESAECVALRGAGEEEEEAPEEFNASGPEHIYKIMEDKCVVAEWEADGGYSTVEECQSNLCWERDPNEYGTCVRAPEGSCGTKGGFKLLPLATYDTCPAMAQKERDGGGQDIQYVDLSQHDVGNVATGADCPQWDGKFYKDRDLEGKAGSVYGGFNTSGTNASYEECVSMINYDLVNGECSAVGGYGPYSSATECDAAYKTCYNSPGCEGTKVAVGMEGCGGGFKLLPLSTYDTCPAMAQKERDGGGQDIQYVDLSQHEVGNVATGADCPQWDGKFYKDRDLRDKPGTVYGGFNPTGYDTQQQCADAQCRWCDCKEVHTWYGQPYLYTDCTIVDKVEDIKSYGQKCNKDGKTVGDSVWYSGSCGGKTNEQEYAEASKSCIAQNWVGNGGDYGDVRAVKTQCRADGCNQALNVDGQVAKPWIDLCNAGDPSGSMAGWSCCADHNTHKAHFA